MKIVAIIASPRGMQGNTGRLLEEVLAGIHETGAETEILSLKSLDVKPCVACDICHKTGICNIRDDYEGIKEKLLACDGFILASPNYIFSVTAQMKALFDRCNGLVHCMALEGKYAAVVETSGGGEDQEVLAAAGALLTWWIFPTFAQMYWLRLVRLASESRMRPATRRARFGPGTQGSSLV